MMTAPKECIALFVQDEELANCLGIHAYYAESEALRHQIIELFRSVVD